MRRRYVAGVMMPLALACVILLGDMAEGPKSAFVGVLTAIPFIAAIFVSPVATLGVGAATLLFAYAFGQYVAVDGHSSAQAVRLLFIIVAALGAVAAAAVRSRLEARALDAERVRTLAALACADPMTKLANRRGAEQWIDRAEPADRWVLMCDADGLKTVNDTHGHEYGDLYLEAIAGRIRSHVAAGDLVARWGGDEFLVVVSANRGDPARLATRLVNAVRDDPIAMDGHQVQPSMSAGIALWPAGGDFTTALREADDRLYRAKRSRPDHALQRFS